MLHFSLSISKTMKIIVATGIYPPTIGGTATYSFHLAKALREKGHEVTVVTYEAGSDLRLPAGQAGIAVSDEIVSVSTSGNFFVRWRRYARALREVGADADAVIALSSISVGVPLKMAKLQTPKKILRLGGDFFWERYTDGRGMKSLKEWYASGFGFWKVINWLFMGRLLRSFDALVYSTGMQQQLHAAHYRGLPPASLLENALPTATPVKHILHTPMRLLCMSRFVGFKNLHAVLDAASSLRDVRLTMVGSGPLRDDLHAHATKLGLDIDWRGPASIRKDEVFTEHDLLIIPSTTEISPNTALEARSHGLPVLLTTETGLSDMLTNGMVLAPLRTSGGIVHAVEEVRSRYENVANAASTPAPGRSWSTVADEWVQLLTSLT